MENREENRNNGRGLFYGTLGVLTLIIAIVGATFAWFTATATGDAVTVTSGTLVIEYTDGTALNASNLKPATMDQVVANQTACTLPGETAPAEHICAKYSFKIENKGTLTAIISASVKNLLNEFPDGVINYVLVEGTSVDLRDVTTPSTFVDTFVLPSGVTLAAGATQAYTLLIWLDEDAVNYGANDASGKTLSGTLNVTANQTNYTTTP